MAASTDSITPVTISYTSLLQDDLAGLQDPITRAFGSSPDALGIIILKDLPEDFVKLREDGLRAAASFAALDGAVQDKYTDPNSFYTFGWSCGKEMMNGVPDMLKGSYYANPLIDYPDVSDELRKEHPSYLRPNVWPKQEDCPGFEQSFKALAKFMTETGCLLAKACDTLVSAHSDVPSIQKLISGSSCSKARLLHYFPPAGQHVDIDGPNDAVSGSASTNSKADSWCGDHLDHSLLTALCPAMYLFHPDDAPNLEPVGVPAPTSKAGLFIRTRAGKEVKAVIPPGCMAFQTGEALQVLTRGQLQATPHYVASGTEGAILPGVYEALQAKKAGDPAWKEVRRGTVSRETMAVFLQPAVDAVLDEFTGETFGSFTRRILESHH